MFPPITPFWFIASWTCIYFAKLKTFFFSWQPNTVRSTCVKMMYCLKMFHWNLMSKSRCLIKCNQANDNQTIILSLRMLITNIMAWLTLIIIWWTINYCILLLCGSTVFLSKPKYPSILFACFIMFRVTGGGD